MTTQLAICFFLSFMSGMSLGLLGLLFGAFMLRFTNDSSFFSQPTHSPIGKIILAGLLVGIGTRLGMGCTSGHGVCGIARRSGRSLIATVVFILAGMMTVYFTKGA